MRSLENPSQRVSVLCELPTLATVVAGEVEEGAYVSKQQNHDGSGKPEISKAIPSRCSRSISDWGNQANPESDTAARNRGKPRDSLRVAVSTSSSDFGHGSNAPVVHAGVAGGKAVLTLSVPGAQSGMVTPRKVSHATVTTTQLPKVALLQISWSQNGTGLRAQDDRAHRSLVAFALETDWEARFDRAMLGFRRSCSAPGLIFGENQERFIAPYPDYAVKKDEDGQYTAVAGARCWDYEERGDFIDSLEADDAAKVVGYAACSFFVEGLMSGCNEAFDALEKTLGTAQGGPFTIDIQQSEGEEKP